MPTAAAYIRVSTEDQMEFSPDSQLRSIQAYALNHHIELLPAHIYLDEGISGRNTSNNIVTSSSIHVIANDRISSFFITE